MNELGRRYFLFASTPRGRQRIAGALVAVACVTNLAISTFGRDHLSSRAIAASYAFSCGLLLAAVVFLIATRRRA